MFMKPEECQQLVGIVDTETLCENLWHVQQSLMGAHHPYELLESGMRLIGSVDDGNTIFMFCQYNNSGDAITFVVQGPTLISVALALRKSEFDTVKIHPYSVKKPKTRKRP